MTDLEKVAKWLGCEYSTGTGCYWLTGIGHQWKNRYYHNLWSDFNTWLISHDGSFAIIEKFIGDGYDTGYWERKKDNQIEFGVGGIDRHVIYGYGPTRPEAILNCAIKYLEVNMEDIEKLEELAEKGDTEAIRSLAVIDFQKMKGWKGDVILKAEAVKVNAVKLINLCNRIEKLENEIENLILAKAFLKNIDLLKAVEKKYKGKE